MEKWRIFMAGVRYGQASPVRLDALTRDQDIARLGITPEKVARWLAEEKADWKGMS